MKNRIVKSIEIDFLDAQACETKASMVAPAAGR
jgi:hypothetical protein